MTDVIAIDGPSGSGKSSTARGVAKRLGFEFLDTGAMYRAATLAVLNAGIDPEDHSAVDELVASIELVSQTDPRKPAIFLNNEDVSEAIRSQEVTAAVSFVASSPRVREAMVTRQRANIATAPGIVVEGRDIGSVVAPDAILKIYLVADPKARAQRRAAEANTDVAQTKDALLVRDEIDSTREVSPLTQASGAVVVDSTHLSLDEVIDRICSLYEEAKHD